MITRRENFDRQRQRFVRGGLLKLQVIADFDRTLTTNFYQGRKSLSLLGALRASNFLGLDYQRQSQALFDYYSPFENDHSLTIIARKSLMAEWWEKQFQLLITSGLNKNHINQVIDSRLANLRPGVPEFIKLLEKHQVPLVIFSASGLGESALRYFLEKENLWSNNISLIANDFIWDEGGRAVAVRAPIIHSGNKDETMLADFGCLERVRNRNNILLLGDSLGDADMATGFSYQALLKIGFLNDKIQESLPAYRSLYDALVLNDGDFSLPLEILQEIIAYAD